MLYTPSPEAPRRIRHGGMKWLRILVLITLFPAIALASSQASSTPIATTAVDLTISVNLSGDDVGLSRFYRLQAQAGTSINTSATTVSAIQETLNLPTTAPGSLSSIHEASAKASIIADVPGNTTIARFSISQLTEAKASANEPFFSRSMASSQGAAWIGVKRIDADFTGATLDITWDFDAFQLQAAPIGSLAYLKNTMNILQIDHLGQGHQSEIGLLSYLINGEAITKVFDSSGTENNWMADATHFDKTAGTLTLNDESKTLNLSIPLAFGQDAEELLLEILSTHTQVSYEAPPRAVVQVEAAAGYRATDRDTGDGSDPQVHWDSDKGNLSFDLIPIGTLLGSGNTSIGLDDPLRDGYLRIGDFTYLYGPDRLQYFSGSNLQLLDSGKNPILTAIAPTLVIEDSVFSYQGFNGFAPILMFEPIAQSPSFWLKDFLRHLTLDSPYLPELFVGFEGPFDPGVSFSRPVSALVSFAGPIPVSSSGTVSEPNGLWLLCGGLIAFASSRACARLRRR